jgi:hypothetical protein
MTGATHENLPAVCFVTAAAIPPPPSLAFFLSFLLGIQVGWGREEADDCLPGSAFPRTQELPCSQHRTNGSSTTTGSKSRIVVDLAFVEHWIRCDKQRECKRRVKGDNARKG